MSPARISATAQPLGATQTVQCAVCGARRRVSPEVASEPAGTLRWLCGAHSSQMDALLGGGSA